ncbi:hypothetical protein GRF59_15250 [Paenibacillus sp. HJL G12]|uniref:Phage tail-like C-terminal domain-containing protein n=1 Tax=Paenibacillus dendrobii TaxID=2691084 RepID=A0A7X3LIV1_9BACL|nr:phage tail domain-containing protein [Paenibacillus dendrobii]MWV44978.1 hypothetical protein [Paenibacillus dendrobii]
MTIAESLYFVYDGVRSDEMGLLNVNMQSGMLEEIFLPEQSITEVTIRGRDTPYFIETKRSPFTLSLSFAFEDTFDEDKIRSIVNWLSNQPYYKPLYFSDNLNKWYYTIYTGEAKLLHNALKQGYITIEMRNISPYTYSPIYQSGVFDYSNNVPEGSEFVLNNTGTLNCKPLIRIEKVGLGEIKIVNYSNRGETFSIINLVEREIVDIDCEQEDITSDIPLTYHFDNATGNYPSFVPGMNFLRVYGNCKIQWTYQFAQ